MNNEVLEGTFPPRAQFIFPELPLQPCDLINYNHGHNILELYNVLIQTRLTTSKTKRDI